MTASPDVEAGDGDSPEATGHALDPPLRRSRLSRVLRVTLRSRLTRLVFLAIVVALLVAALVDQGGDMWRDIQKLSAPVIFLAFAGQIGSLAFSVLVWRELLADLGSRMSMIDAWRIYFIAQLGKYMPGKVWQIVAQAELSKDVGVPRDRSAMSALLALGVTIVTGGLVAAATLPFDGGGSVTHYLWFLLVIPFGVAAMSPPVMNRLLSLALKLLKRPPLAKGVSLGGLLRATGLAIAQWLCLGGATFVLLHRLGDHQSNLFLASSGAYALSWVVGFLAIIAPAGIGAREAVLVAALSGQSGTSAALAIALLTRGLAVAGDAITGLTAAALVGQGRFRRLRSAKTDPGSEASGGALQ